MDAHELEAADSANAEGLWLDFVAAFNREPAVSPVNTLVALLADSEFLPLPLPAPKVTLINRVARFVLRRF